MKVIYIISMLIIYLEMIFKIFILNKVDVGDVVYTILFSMQTIMVLNLLCNIFKEKVSKILFIILSTIITIYFGVQAVFYNLFSVPFSFSTLGLAKGAFGFTDMVKEAIGNNIFNILIILIPLVLGIVLISMKKITFEQYNKKTILFKSGILVLVIIFSIGMILVDRKDTYSPYNLYFKRDAQEKNIETFGVLNSTLIDIQRTIFGFKEEMIIEVSSTNIKEEPEEEFEENEIKKEITYNKLDLNLNAINSSNKSLQQLIEYIEATEPTNKNEYTGYFEGKNLIFNHSTCLLI